LRFYQCDYCKKEVPGKAPVILKGYLRKFDGCILLLLPDQFHEKHFCKRDCFRDWMKEDFQHEKEEKGIETEIF
jgi:hypothetical protein